MIQTRPLSLPPLSLYIHIPWCIKKCPYCDFNSYEKSNLLPEQEYVEQLLSDLKQDLQFVQDRPIQSIFFGGGTPSLFSAQAFDKIITGAANLLSLSKDIEITLEANPGTLEHKSFQDYAKAGINRISLGAQSFQTEKLKALGRIHQAAEIQTALEKIHQAGIKNFNIDLMFGLPNQSVEDALFDLNTALSFKPKHLSWYHLTLEPNTFFAKYPPVLPEEDTIDALQSQGLQLLKNAGYQQYEVSAFAQAGFECRHNLNYWTFGDYLGIGAGAHGKVTVKAGSHFQNPKILRYAKVKTPKAYLSKTSPLLATQDILISKHLPFEFMLNTLRLMQPISKVLFEDRTGLSFSTLEKPLAQAENKGLLTVDEHQITLTDLGKRFLNDVITLFLQN